MDDTAQRLMDAAARLFRENGYDKTSLKKITQEVGISTPAAYWHFESKQNLLFQVLRRLITQFVASLQDAVDQAEDEPTIRLEALVRAYVEIQLKEVEQASSFTALYGTGQMLDRLPEAHRQELLASQRKVVDLFRSTIKSGIDQEAFLPTDPLVCSFAVISMCEQVISWYRPHGQMTIAEVVDYYSQFVLRMVGAESAST